MKIYAFSGLAADGRIFSQLSLDYEVIPVKWIKPEKQESLSSYAVRIGEQIDQKETFVLLGVSFGGMLVAELAKTMRPRKIILISSATNKNELPWMAHVSRLLNLHNLLPSRVYKPPVWTTYLSFPSKKHHREIAKGIIKDMDCDFVKWAIGAIVNWESETVPENMIHIHGRLDPIIPLKQRMNAEVLGIGHFIILKNAEEISGRINELLKD